MAKKQHKPSLASLMAKKLDGLSESKVMQLIGMIIDFGTDEQSLAALDHAADLLDQFLGGEVSARFVCRAHYFRANIWSTRRHASPNRGAWLWRSESVDGEILELRRALKHPGFAEINAIERAQIYTNLGNILNHAGRFVEAIEYWDRALAAVPQFAMACGNRGLGLCGYAGALYDSGHHGVLIAVASDALAQACSKEAVIESPDYGEALTQFAKRLRDIWSHYDIPRMIEEVDLMNHSMGRSNRERKYRQWCLNNRLFITPLNDVGPNPIAARDVMTLPSITVETDEGPGPPAVIRYFNLIKQEFSAARYALYEGIISSGVHFSDRGVLLYNTLDYPVFGFAMERVKMAFRGAYAVFDKSAFLLNAYLKLEHPERQVNFRNLWFAKGKGTAFQGHFRG
jgi:tetratricopeptide (TPR) repeat protein